MKYLLIGAWFALFTLWPLQFNCSAQTRKSYPQADHGPSSQAAISITNQASPKDEADTENIGYKGNEKSVRITQMPIDNWYRAYVIATIIIVGVGGFGVYKAHQTLKAIELQGLVMERQTVATEIAANAAKASAEVILQRERSWIFIKEITALTGSGSARSCAITFENFGNTPATIVSQTAWFAISRWDGQEDFWTSNYHISKEWDGTETMRETVIPSSEHILHLTDKTPQDIESENSEYSVELCGFIAYRDVFDFGKSTAPHETLFCMQYGKEANPNGKLWEKSGTPRDNRET